uniref:Uncharacterized protein n=1 Tax=Molossus molossus TaxID=27622 RepID=A0A7J8BYE8_MOLMO|nr:hypothetical protein HJG59_010037 [Molossus molossus]
MKGENTEYQGALSSPKASGTEDGEIPWEVGAWGTEQVSFLTPLPGTNLPQKGNHPLSLRDLESSWACWPPSCLQPGRTPLTWPTTLPRQGGWCLCIPEFLPARRYCAGFCVQTFRIRKLAEVSPGQSPSPILRACGNNEK